jgi:hypothetical protein
MIEAGRRWKSPFKKHASGELKALTQLRIQCIDRFREYDRFTAQADRGKEVVWRGSCSA